PRSRAALQLVQHVHARKERVDARPGADGSEPEGEPRLPHQRGAREKRDAHVDGESHLDPAADAGGLVVVQREVKTDLVVVTARGGGCGRLFLGGRGGRKVRETSTQQRTTEELDKSRSSGMVRFVGW